MYGFTCEVNDKSSLYQYLVVAMAGICQYQRHEQISGKNGKSLLDCGVKGIVTFTEELHA
jgi:hypothetical protein